MLAVWVLVGVLAVFLLYTAISFNRLIRTRVRVDNAWSQIDVQLRRRYDLIPNLVEAVRGYAAHEREVFEDVTRARSQAQAASGVRGQADAEQRLTGSLARLIAVAESYPELKASGSFLALQEELIGTESKIAYARQFYNDEVQRLNTLVQGFPSRLVAGLAGVRAREFFEADEPARGPVAVRF